MKSDQCLNICYIALYFNKLSLTKLIYDENILVK